MISSIDQSMLVKLAKTLSLNSQYILRLKEDEIAKEYKTNLFRNITNDVKHYLLLTSLPFSFVDINIDLRNLWHINCRKCKTVIYRKTMPTGNLSPKFFIVGDAPGVGNGELDNKFDRVWVYGQSSHLLRRALFNTGEYFNCWLTNLLKCSTPKNRPSEINEVKTCISQLEKEINLLKPQKIVLLGKHVYDMFPDFGIPIINVYHPSFFIRKGIDYREYAKILKEKLK